MEIFDKEEIALIEAFRKERQEKELNKTRRQVAYKKMKEAMREFWDAGGFIRSEKNDFGNYLLLDDTQYYEDLDKEPVIVLYWEER